MGPSHLFYKAPGTLIHPGVRPCLSLGRMGELRQEMKRCWRGRGGQAIMEDCAWGGADVGRGLPLSPEDI